MDTLQRCGATFRAVRIKRGWRQTDVAARAGVDRSLISAIERGHLEHVSVGTLLAIARVLEIQVTLNTRWRAGDLDRLISSRHGRLHEAVARWFSVDLPDWILAPEVSFSIFGERGVIDILAWHPGRRALLVIELKTDIVDVNELVGTMDRRRRLAWDIARGRGWSPLTVSTWVLVAGGRTNRARLAAHRAVLRAAFPIDGREMAGWLRRPDRSVDALSLWERSDGGSASNGGSRSADLAARHRVRRPRVVARAADAPAGAWDTSAAGSKDGIAARARVDAAAGTWTGASGRADGCRRTRP